MKQGNGITSGKNGRRQKCEVYSRVVGYLRPVRQWNNGKKQEFSDRREFVIATN